MGSLPLAMPTHRSAGNDRHFPVCYGLRMARRLNARAKDFEQQFSALLNSARDTEDDVSRAAGEIIADVRARGDAALIELSARFDRVTLTAETLRVPFAEIDAAYKSADAEVKSALSLAAKRIEAYHSRQVPLDESFTDESGAKLGWRWTPIQSVGLYVPGGTASYPSSVLMNAMPARVAGVSRIVMVTPASGGTINPLTLAAAKLAGISEIYRVGGAQAVAALAYGTATIAPVDKIVGPGNAYVAAAKRAGVRPCRHRFHRGAVGDSRRRGRRERSRVDRGRSACRRPSTMRRRSRSSSPTMRISPTRWRLRWMRS